MSFLIFAEHLNAYWLPILLVSDEPFLQPQAAYGGKCPGKGQLLRQRAFHPITYPSWKVVQWDAELAAAGQPQRAARHPTLLRPPEARLAFPGRQRRAARPLGCRNGFRCPWELRPHPQACQTSTCQTRPAPGIARIASPSAFAACWCALPAPCDASSSLCRLRWALAGWQRRSFGAQGVSVVGCCGYGVGTIA